MIARFLIAILAGAVAAAGQTNVTTGGYSNARTNWNQFEQTLNTSNVNPKQFGKLFALAVDGEIYAQPLYVANVAIPGKGVHNVVYVATMHNTVYAFDADAAADPLWQVNLGPSVPTADYDTLDIDVEDGILSTPVIDPASGALYVVADTKENGNYIYRLHALDITTGAEKMNGPAVIAASVPGTGEGSVNGTLTFDPFLQLQRPALLLLNGVVYLGFGSHGDGGAFHGWLMGYDATNVQRQTAVRCFTPNGAQGAVWQAGRGPAADYSGYIYVATSNGTWDGKTELSQSILKLSPAQNLAVTDWFTVSDWQQTSATDYDLGSTGIALIPGTHYALTGNKSGNVYVADTSNLGGLTDNDSGVYQKFNVYTYGIFNEAAWQAPDGPILIVQGFNDTIRSFQMTDSRFAPTASSQSSRDALGAVRRLCHLLEWIESGNGRFLDRDHRSEVCTLHRYPAGARRDRSVEGAVEQRHGSESRHARPVREIRQSHGSQRQGVRAHVFEPAAGVRIVAASGDYRRGERGQLCQWSGGASRDRDDFWIGPGAADARLRAARQLRPAADFVRRDRGAVRWPACSADLRQRRPGCGDRAGERRRPRQHIGGGGVSGEAF